MSYDYNKIKDKIMTVDEAVKMIKDGDRIFVGTNTGIPYSLCDALWERRNELNKIDIGINNCLVDLPLLVGKEENPFSEIYSFFLGAGERDAEKAGRHLHYTSFHLAQVDLWFREIFRPNVCMLRVSAPDENGRISLGPTGMSVYLFAIEMSDRVILQVDNNVPYMINADERCFVDINQASAIILEDCPNTEIPDVPVDETTKKISEGILAEIEDGATLQIGIGSLSTAIAYGLKERNDLGIYTELFTSPLMDLMKNGNVNNKHKGYLDGVSVCASATGTEEFYRFLDYNPEIYCSTYAFVNDVYRAARNNKMTSINSVMSLNLFGEAAADIMKFRQFSGIGGQLEFVRAAQMSNGGKSFLACTSCLEKNGVRKSRIVLDFEPGTAVSTPRSDVQYVATEYGCVNLKKLSMDERARALINLAHPDFRDQLTDEAKAHGLIW